MTIRTATLVVGLAWLAGCGGSSPVSTADAVEPGSIHPHVELLRDERYYANGADSVLSSMHVVLRDGDGRAIENPKIRIHLNGLPLGLKVAIGNYYDRSPFYDVTDTTGNAVRPDTE